ncbi:hypothetical protein BGX31_004773, partial [Mortierella sp. GBA43]
MQQLQVYKKHFTDAAMEQAPTTPGMKYRHYSPEAEVVLVEYIRPPETTQGPGSTTVSSTSSPSSSSPSAAAVSSTPSSLSSSSPASSPSTSTTSPQYSLILKEIENLRLEGKKRFGILRTSFTSPLTDTTVCNGSSTTSPTATNGDNGGHVNGSSSGDDSGSSCVIEFPLGQAASWLLFNMVWLSVQSATMVPPKIQDVGLTTPRLSNLTDKNLMIFQRNHFARLSIEDVQEDEIDQLEEFLRGASSLKHLRIGCRYDKSLTFIDRVMSTREKIIEDTGSICLQTFELMKEDLIPFSTLSYYSGDHIQSHISFQDGSSLFDMRTWICQGGNTALWFVRRYGWSIAFYDG